MSEAPLLTEMGDVVWTPSRETVEGSELMRFVRKVGAGSLAGLHTRAGRDPGWFWGAVMEDLGLRWRVPYSRVLDDGLGMAEAKWCVGGRMNVVDNLLVRQKGTEVDGRAAVVWEGEDGRMREMTYAELRGEVGRAAAGLRRLGVGKGDVVGVFMPMVPEIVVGMLAVIAVGGIFLPLFSGFGPEALATRLADGGAKALLTAEGCTRRGKWVAMKPIADEAVSRVASVRTVVALGGKGTARSDGVVEVGWEALTGGGGNEGVEDTSAEDVMMLIHTSGTTGKPKGAVHTHCGFPVKAAADMAHGFDVRAGDRVFWATDMGWMMGPWLVFGTLLLGATMVLYDGAVDHPGAGRLWELAERHGVTTLGVSPTLVRAMMRHGVPEGLNLETVRNFGSTGEPWNPGPWRWLFEEVGRSVKPIINYSGGTEISGGILCGNVCSPLKPCGFDGPMPGMVAEVWDDAGKSVVGKVGELVIRAPWIGMTRGFWNDRERYLETYFSGSREVWVHGDFATVDADGQWWILGRSDDTLKIAGKRLGPAEVESLLVGQQGVVEAVAVGVPDEVKGEALVCFCVLRPGLVGDDGLRAALLAGLVRELGKPLAPKELKFVPELPRTRNGKIMRRAVKAAYLGREVGDVSGLKNLGALEGIRGVTKEE